MVRRLLGRLFLRNVRSALLTLVLFVPIPLLLAQGAFLLFHLRQERVEALRNNLEVARAVARVFHVYIENLQDEELTVAQALAALGDRSPDRIREFLLSISAQHPGVYALTWVDPDGRVRASTNQRMVGKDLGARRSQFGHLLAVRERVLTDLFPCPERGKPVFIVARSIRSTEGAFLGAIEAVVDPERIGSVLVLRRSRGGGVLLRDRRGLPVTGHPVFNWTWEQRERAAKLPLVRKAVAGLEVTGVVDPVLGGRGKLLAAASPIGDTGWSAWAALPVGRAMRGEFLMRLSEAGLLLGVALFGLVGALRVSRTIADPVRRLRDHAVAVGSGDLDRAVAANGPEELCLLADSMNRMTGDLREREAERERMLQAERSARGEAERVRGRISAILESITDAFIAVEPDGRITYFNRAAERILRTRRAEALGTSVWDLHQGEFGVYFRGDCQVAVSMSETIDFTLFYPRLSAWLEVHAYPGAGGLSLYLQDVSDRERAVRALEESQRRLAEAQRFGRMGHWEIDLETHRVSWSDEVFHLYERDPALGPPSFGERAMYYEPDDWMRLTAAMDRAALTGERKTGDYRMRFPSGAKGQHFVLIEPIKDRAGRVVKLRGIVQDVTERKRLEDELRQARDAADAANLTKSEFLANMSHEVRTPMNSVMGLTELLLQSELSPDQRRLLGLVRDSAESLLQVIGDILDFSKIEAGKLDFEQAEFEVRSTVEAALERVAAGAHRKGLELVCNVAPEVPVRLVGDAARLQQVLVNLAGNAVKFTQKGWVSVRVGAPVDPSVEDGKCLLRVSVEDTGIGISREQTSRLFERFSQVDGSLTRRHTGSGLGLAICRRIVQAMGGSIGVESVPGKGSTFFFTALLPIGEEQPEASPGERSLQGVRVLAVCDTDPLRRLLVDLLGRFGIETRWTSRAAALETLAEAADQGEVFDLLLLDREPGGVEAFALAESLPRDPCLRVPLVLLVPVHELVSDTRRCREVDAFCVVKPVKPAELRRALEEALGRAQLPSEPSSPDAPAEETARDLHILLAEDNATARLLVEMLLEQKGWSFVSVGSGDEVLEALSGENRFDVVLMDVQMPGMDGLTATRVLRDRESQTRNGRGPMHLPVIGLTAHALKGDREKCLEAGMDDYLSKPVKAEALYAAIARWTRGRGAEQPAPGGACDLGGLRTGLKGNEEAVRRIVATFLEDLPGKIGALGAALADREPEHVHRAAHALRGGLTLLDAKRACDLASRLEELARASELAQAEALLRELEEELGRVEACLISQTQP